MEFFSGAEMLEDGFGGIGSCGEGFEVHVAGGGVVSFEVEALTQADPVGGVVAEIHGLVELGFCGFELAVVHEFHGVVVVGDRGAGIFLEGVGPEGFAIVEDSGAEVGCDD